jgi:MFS family permease
VRARSLTSLFLVSLFGLAFETFLTRYLALDLFSEYSYWVISMALLGYSVGGVLLTLLRDRFYRRRTLYLLLIPVLLLAATILAFWVLRVNPLNPLKLQNPALWKSQLPNVLLYYLGLFPVFLLTGTFIGLNFLIYSREIPKVYAVDLLGSAAGSVVILGAMFLMHPYHLPALLFPVLLAVILLNAAGVLKRIPAAGSAALFAGCLGVAGFGMYFVLSSDRLSVPEFKSLHPILNIQGWKVEASSTSPGGYYLVVSDYTELDDIGMTNNYQLLRVGSPPRTFGLYKDYGRIGPMLEELPTDLSYIRGSLPYFPYTIRKNPSVLLVGTNGGLKIVESAHSGAAGGVALEQQGEIYRLVRERLRKLDPPRSQGSPVRLLHGSAFSFLRGYPGRFDIIEISSDFLRQGGGNDYAFTREAVELYLRSLKPGGILSVPIDISELDVYCLKMVNTILAALVRTGAQDPTRHLMAYRTAWSCQLLVCNIPFSAAEIESLKRYCSDRSFDTPYYPGIDPATVSVWNDLPPVSFQTGEVHRSRNAQDALMEDLGAILSGGKTIPEAERFFNLAPSTLQRPSFYAISRLSKLRELFARIEILPEQEVGYLLNVVVLAQALVLALVVLLLPLAAGMGRRGGRPGRQLRGGEKGLAARGRRSLFLRMFLYFGTLALGFFFIELALIDRFAFFLGSSSFSFGVVVAVMLVFSGLGSWYSSRFRSSPYRGLLGALPIIGASLLGFLFLLDPLLELAIALPLAVRVLIVVAVMAPLCFALGRPFALGTSALQTRSDSYVTWAWAMNGALSVVATPLANLLSAGSGWRVVFAAALLLYLSTALTFPIRKLAAPAGQGRRPEAVP